MEYSKSSRVIHLKTVREKKIIKTACRISFISLFSLFIFLSIENNHLFLTEMLSGGGIISMTLLLNFISEKQGLN